MLEKFNKNLISIAIIIAGLLIAGAVVYINQGKSEEQAFNPQEIAEKAINYINQNLLTEGFTASLVDVVEESGLYKIKIKIGEQEFESYVSQDGEVLFIEGIKMTETSESPPGESETQGTSKRDTPDVKLFVMSYCPYGLQAQKMFLPVYDLLKDKAEMGVYFVNYIMHEKKEIEENLRQYCVQKEEKEKYSGYLSCFVQEGDYQKCFSQAGINQGKIENCIFEIDKEFSITSKYNDQSTWLNGNYPKFDVQTDLNEKYGVSGSPTVVINDQVVSINPRTPENFKNIICQAFSSPPEECSQTLSNDTPSPGLGGGTGSSNGGSCQ